MPIDFQRRRAVFDAASGGPRSTILDFSFISAVLSAEAAINGFDISFTNGEHLYLRTQIDTEVILIQGNTAKVRVDYGIRDGSGNFDDPYNGFVDVLLIVNRQ